MSQGTTSPSVAVRTGPDRTVWVRDEPASNFIDYVYENRRAELGYAPRDVSDLDLGGSTLGNYLHEDCRNAIAHITRNDPTRTAIDFDDLRDHARVARITRIAESLAKVYIRDKLKLVGRLYLVRPASGGFPRYVTEDEAKAGTFSAAYPWEPRRPLANKQQRRWETCRPWP
jgi:hypothetical protein